MKNPWLAKNPFMSAWLTAFNASAGAVRGRMTADANRQATTMMTEATRQAFRFWTGGQAATPKARKRTRTR